MFCMIVTCLQFLLIKLCHVHSGLFVHILIKKNLIEPFQFAGHTSNLKAAIFSRDGKKIFSASDDKSVRLVAWSYVHICLVFGFVCPFNAVYILSPSALIK